MNGTHGDALLLSLEVVDTKRPTRHHAARSVLFPVAVLAMSLAAACSASAPEYPGIAPPAPSSTASPTRTLGPRPREIRLDGMDFAQACALIPKEQFKDLGVKDLGFEDRGIEAVGPHPWKDNDGNDSCGFDHYSTKPNWGLLIGPVTQRDASIWLAGDSSTATILDPITVDGFPAVPRYLTGSDHQCSIAVSVAAGQYLDVTFGITTPNSGQTIGQVCRWGAEIADTVTKNLIAQRK